MVTGIHVGREGGEGIHKLCPFVVGVEMKAMMVG